MIWNSTEVEKALAVVGSCQPQLLLDLKSLLDSYHGTSRSAEYYDFVAGEWLMDFSHAIYAAYVDAAGGQTAAGQTDVSVFADFNDYVRTVSDGLHFGDQLRQQVSRVLGAAETGSIRFMRATCFVGSRPGGIADRVRRRLKRAVFSTLGREDAPLVICNPYFKGAVTDWAATLWGWRSWARQDNFQYAVGVTVEVDAEWRRARTGIAPCAEFADVVRALLPLYLPVVYLEALAPYRRKAQALQLPRPAVLYTANSLLGHTLFKLLAADWREEGTRILNHQHGGGYGMDRVHAVEDYETRVADRFYTWGWKGPSPKQVPLAATLSASRFPPRRESRVLLSCGSYPRNLYRIHFQPMPGTIEKVISETEVFVREARGRLDLVLRPYMVDFGWGLVEILRQVNPELELDDPNTAGLQSYACSSLVVHNYLGTSWLETLALNIPTVCFYDAATYAFRDAVQPHIAALTSAGVLHTSGRDAAAFVRSVMSDPEGWWRKQEVQDARRDFVRDYANFSSDWATEWEAEFRRWID